MAKAKPKPAAPTFTVVGVDIPIRPDFAPTLGRMARYRRELAPIEDADEFLDFMVSFMSEAVGDTDRAALDAALDKVVDYGQVNDAVASLFAALTDRPTQAPASS